MGRCGTWLTLVLVATLVGFASPILGLAKERKVTLSWQYPFPPEELANILEFRVYKAIGEECQINGGILGTIAADLPTPDASGNLVLSWVDQDVPDAAGMLCYELTAVGKPTAPFATFESVHSQRGGVARQAKPLTWGDTVDVQ